MRAVGLVIAVVDFVVVAVRVNIVVVGIADCWWSRVPSFQDMVQNRLETSCEPFWRVDVELGLDFTNKVVEKSHRGVFVEDHVDEGPVEVFSTQSHETKNKFG